MKKEAGKGDRDRANPKKYRDRAPDAGIPEKPLNNLESEGKLPNEKR
jgi:hypothetical protein